MRVDASIIIITHNSESWIEKCVDSLQNQDFSGSYEIIIVDNGSKDKTVELIKQKYGNVNLIEQNNIGFGAGNNIGAMASKGKYLAFINPDTIADPGWLENLIAPLVGPKIISTSKIVLLEDPGKINTCGNIIHFCCFGFVNEYQENVDSVISNGEIDGISGAAFAICKNDFVDLGMFDENYFLFCEDTEFSIRARRNGYSIILAANSVMAHNYELQLNPEKIYYLEYGRWTTIKKHISYPQQIILFPSLVIAEILVWILLLSKRPSAIRWKLKACRDSLSNPKKRYKGVQLDIDHFSKVIPFHTISKNRFITICGTLINSIFIVNFYIMKFMNLMFSFWPLSDKSGQSGNSA